MADPSEEYHPVDMKRFWFCVYDEAPLFHADLNCSHLKNNVARHRQNLAVAHIPVDSNEIGEPSRLRFCGRCGVDDPFD